MANQSQVTSHGYAPRGRGKAASPSLYQGFMDLPNELLTLIFDILDPSDLYNLLLLCRRLNYVVLPIYFSRQGTLDPSTSSIDATVRIGPDNFHVLPPVITSPPFMCCDTLFCEFNRSTLLRDIHRLGVFLSKFLYVRKLTLDFRYVFNLNAHLSIPDQWLPVRTGLQIIFATALAKSCEDLTVEEHTYFSAVGQMLWPAEGRFTRWCQRVGMAIMGEHKNRSIDREEVPIFPATKLKIFNIHSMMLLHPMFHESTIRILNSSTITSLVFRAGRALLSPELWIKILPAITLPALSKLSIEIDLRNVHSKGASRASDIAFSLSQFLLRHPSITHLQCRGLPDPPSINKWKKLCPRLESLESSTRYLLYFLQPANVFSSLSYISMSSPPPGPFDFTAVENVLAVITRRTGSITLGIIFPTLPAFHADHNILNPWLRARIRSAQSAERFLHCVKKLELAVPIQGSDRYIQFYEGASVLLPAWMALFPDLRHVEIRECFRWASLATKVAFVRLLNQACPMVETVQLELEKHDILSWCSMSPSIDGSTTST